MEQTIKTRLIDKMNTLEKDCIATVRVHQDDFARGTYRITKPGLYILESDIIFAPNAAISNSIDPVHLNVLDNYMPATGDAVYSGRQYGLGFFAAITIECDDVILDLNGYTLCQSKLHYVQQRFYANIELNDSPFIIPANSTTTQGPADFGSCGFNKNIWIRNGTLGRSSHHGIHGNGAESIIIENIRITGFEVAGIALNGCENVLCQDIDIDHSSTDVDVNFLYSNAIFTRRALVKLYDQNPSASIVVCGETRTILDILTTLTNTMIDEVYVPVLDCLDVHEGIFHNPTHLPEGNLYGIVLNTMGVVIGDFARTYKPNIGNTNIVLQNITIRHLDSFPREIVGLTLNGKLVKGVVGNILPIKIASNEGGVFGRNIVFIATAIMGKYNTSSSGSLHVPSPVLEWIKSTEPFSEYIKHTDLQYFNLRDQMGHFMKGNITLFISGGKNIFTRDITLYDIKNSGQICECTPDQFVHFKRAHDAPRSVNCQIENPNYIGDTLTMILITAARNVSLVNITARTPALKCTSLIVKGDSCGICSSNILIGPDVIITDDEGYCL